MSSEQSAVSSEQSAVGMGVGSGMAESRVLIAGVGEAGCRVVDLVAGQGGGLTVAAIDTDAESLERSAASTKLQVGAASCAGVGTGGDAPAGRAAAEEDRALLSALVAEADLVLVFAGLAGGTGGGVAPVLLAEASEQGSATVCAAIEPFDFEGSARVAAAQAAMAEIEKVSDAIIVIRNDRLCESVDSDRLADSFAKANETLADAALGVARMFSDPGYIRLDFGDFRRALGEHGVGALGFGAGTGRDRARRALESLLSGPMLDEGRLLSTADTVLVSIGGGPDLKLTDVAQVMEGISSAAGTDSRIAMGTVVHDGWEKRLLVTAIPVEGVPLREDVGAVANAVSTGSRAEAGAASRPPRRQTRKRKAEQLQAKLSLDVASRGRFRNAAPTIMDGEDLDIPTYKRRGVEIEV